MGQNLIRAGQATFFGAPPTRPRGRAGRRLPNRIDVLPTAVFIRRPQRRERLLIAGSVSDQLSKWGYKVNSVPNLDDRIKACQDQIGISQVQCWVAFDQYLMEEIVPAVPLLVDTAPWVFSARVASFSWDQVAGVPTLDRLALKPSV